MEPWLRLSFHGAHPGGPVWIEDYGVAAELNEEGGVSNPGYADAIVLWWFEVGVEGFAFGLAKHLRDDAVPPKAIGTLPPALLGGKAGVGCSIGGGHG